MYDGSTAFGFWFSGLLMGCGVGFLTRRDMAEKSKQQALENLRAEYKAAIDKATVRRRELRDAMRQNTKEDILRLGDDELSRRVASLVCCWKLGPNKFGEHGGEWLSQPEELQTGFWATGERTGLLNEHSAVEYWNPAGNHKQAWIVFRVVMRHLFSTRRKFFDELQEIASKAHGRDSAHLVAWPDVLLMLEDCFPRAVCQAALIAVACKGESR